MAEEFKPNIYPIMYWALMFGLSAGVILFLLSVLSRYITVIWFPVFLVGLIWGGYRNYQRQRHEWERTRGVPPTPVSPVDEFREATRDVIAASRELLTQQPPQDRAPADTASTPSASPVSDTQRQQQPPPAPPPRYL